MRWRRVGKVLEESWECVGGELEMCWRRVGNVLQDSWECVGGELGVCSERGSGMGNWERGVGSRIGNGEREAERNGEGVAGKRIGKREKEGELRKGDIPHNKISP